MYKIKHIKSSEQHLGFIEMKSTNGNAIAMIFLDFGGSVQELLLDNHIIIKDLNPLPYNITYASAILFPFANRIKNGKYSFQKKSYKLSSNEKERQNALHGLVFNKRFNVLNENISEDRASVELIYTETKRNPGFPFLYTINQTYTLTQNTLNLKISIKNTDTSSFPFTIGWHPYFYSSDLYHSYLKFKSTKKIVFDKNLITKNIEHVEQMNRFAIKDKNLDDCYILEDNEIEFTTPDYDLVMKVSSKENYLQLYTPNNTNTIAIEPITGPSNSFNNQLGLQILEPGENYFINWNIQLNTN